MSYRPSVQAEVIGAGTNYALTGTFARIDFGTTDPEIVLPTAGTYLIYGAVCFIFSVVASSAGDSVLWGFRNSTDSVSLAVQSPWTNPSATLVNYQTISNSVILEVTASKTIQLWAQNTTPAARGAILSSYTSIRYVRLY